MALMTKKCRDCGIEKSNDDFGFSRGRYLRSSCHSCIAISARQWRLDHPGANKAAVKRYRKERRDYVWNLKRASPCVDCGGFFHPVQMHFDHLPEFEKLGNVSTISSHESLESIKAEIEKCEIVCANCHALRTYMRHQP